MATKVTAQTTLSGGSFVLASETKGHLTKGKMYRVKTTKQESKYVILDETFCGTEELKNKSINFNTRFTLISEDAVKEQFKKLLKQKGFRNGQVFTDVRSGDKLTISDESRTHILAKFGKFIGVKIASGHAWFAGKHWAIGEKTMPTEEEEKAETPKEEMVTHFYVVCETHSEAVDICNRYGQGDEKWLAKWDVYASETAYRVDKRSMTIGTYSRESSATESGVFPVLTYKEWTKDNVKSKTKQRKTVDMTKGSLESQIFAVVDEHLDSDESRQHMSNSVEKLLNKWGVDKNVRQLEVTIDKTPPVKVGKIHFKFDLVLKCMMARTNIALVGAAGSGKTTTVAKAAEALKLKFFSKSVSAQTGAHEFFGYQDAQGRYVRTLFRDAYEFGGVFLLDEFDAGNPNVLAALNQATANEHCAFADDMIPKHKDFICVMAGNTFGHGANSEYVGRNKIDAATLDRFAFIDFPYDEDLEHALASNKAWCKKVQAIRRKVADKKIRTVVSPRATIMGGQLLANGITEAEIMELLIYKGMNQEERNLLK